jgi:precorrin-2 dehydrogenase/sirohydrochlorin ferrochelatase
VTDLNERTLRVKFFPAFIHLQDQRVLVVGGGEIAARKTELALSAGAAVTVVSPEFCPTLQRLSVTRIDACYQPEQLLGVRLCFACTDDETVNRQIYRDCEQTGVLVNVVDAPHLCRFITPSIVDREPLQLAIASGGSSPVLVRLLRERFEAELSPTLGELAAFAGRVRERVKGRLSSLSERRQLWEQFFALAMDARDDAEREQLLERALTGTASAGELITLQTTGNRDDVTLGQLRRMQQANVVYYPAAPRLLPLVELARRDAEKRPFEDSESARFEAEQRAARGERVLWIEWLGPPPSSL